jgi:crotonobetainyl-CoA:carnitine CoA-transferase CaiB-like acyl-CoA transferase
VKRNEASSGQVPVRVLDLGRFFSAPSVATQLGDFGAEVVKIESPDGGDPVRHYGVGKPGMSNQWLVEGRNKYSATLDIASDDGRRSVARLAEWADVLVENFRPGTMARWGLDYTSLSARNPRLVYLSLSGYGQFGPYRDRGALDGVACAFGGLTYVTGESASSQPVRSNYYLADYLAGMFGALGVLEALRRRDAPGSDGLGEYIDLALYEPLLRLADSAFVDYAADSVIRVRTGGRSRVTSPGGVYQCADGRWVQINVANESSFRRFCDVVGRRWPTADGSGASLWGDMPAVESVTSEWALENDSAAIVRALSEAGVPASAVNSVADLGADEHVAERRNLVDVKAADGSLVTMQNVLPRLGRRPGAIRWPGQRLGQSNDYVFGEILGMSQDEISDMRMRGVI